MARDGWTPWSSSMFHGRWRYAYADRRDSYSMVLFGAHGPQYEPICQVPCNAIESECLDMNSLNPIGPISICFLATALAGCSTINRSGTGSSATVPSQEKVANACPQLKHIINDAPEDFRTLKGRSSPKGGSSLSQYLTIWKTQPVFPTGDCEIWGWAGGNTEYACFWKHKEEATARARYNQYRSALTKCLGDAWPASEKAMKTGSVTQFTGPEDKTNVYLLHYRDGEVFSRTWRITLVVGDQPFSVTGIQPSQ